MNDLAEQLDAMLSAPGPAPRAYIRAVAARRRRRRAAQAGAALASFMVISASGILWASRPSEAPAVPNRIVEAEPIPPSAKPPAVASVAFAGNLIADPPEIDFDGSPATLGLSYRPHDFEQWLRQ